MAKPTRDIGASVRARLLNLARQKGQVLDLLLTRYAIERLLYRLSISQHRDQCVLKGAMLLITWFDDPHRPTVLRAPAGRNDRRRCLGDGSVAGPPTGAPERARPLGYTGLDAFRRVSKASE